MNVALSQLPDGTRQALAARSTPREGTGSGDGRPRSAAAGVCQLAFPLPWERCSSQLNCSSDKGPRLIL